MEIVKKIRLSEIELRDRNSVLRGFKSNVSDICFGLLGYALTVVVNR